MLKFNILYIANTGQIFGGGEISLLKLLANLDKSKFHPIVVCPAYGSLSEAIQKMGIEVIVIKMETLRKINPFHLFSSVWQMRRFIKARHIDLVHSNGSRATLYSGLAAKFAKVPAIWHVRVIESEGWYDKFLASLCVKLIAVSQAVKKRFDWLLQNKPEKVTVIYNGVDLEEFNPHISGARIRQRYGLSPKTQVVGIVGNLIPWKGQEYFIRAARIIDERITDVKFLIVGDGECRRRLEDLTKELGLEEKIIFAGARRDIPEVMAAMDIIVHSSISPEPFARVIIEALASGKPLVGINSGGVPEIGEDYKELRLVPLRNEVAMAEAVICLLQDKEKTIKMGRRGRRRVENCFDIKANARQTEQVYRELLEKKN
jgi:glycosyltransferase involved in cell wall biosynthesis